MSNKKATPAAGKTVAGKNNYNKNKKAQQKRVQAEKDAKRVLVEKEKRQKQKEKRSEEIRKQRKKASEKAARAEAKNRKKISAKQRRSNERKRFIKKWKYYTSKEFLRSFNYFRIFVCIILPLALIIFGIVSFLGSVFMNVPQSIRAAEYDGRLESDTIAVESVFNAQQQKIFIGSLKSRGSGKFEFYINSIVEIDDEFSTDTLCFGNPETNNAILVATIYDGDGNVLYRSQGVEPGKEINRAKLFDELSYGVHEVKVAVNAYDAKSLERLGTRYAEIKLAVGVDYNGEE